MSEQLHWCYKCQQHKPATGFNRDRTRPSGLQARCRECDTEYKRLMRGTPVRREYIQITDDTFGYWFSGLADGEAHFSASVRINKGYINLHIRFSIGLRLDDMPVLETIQKTLGVGHVISHYRWNTKTPLQKHQADFYVAEAQQIRDVLIPLFDRYPLRTKKQRDYAIWREIALKYGWNGKREDFWKGKPRFTPEELADVRRLCQALKEVRKYVGE